MKPWNAQILRELAALLDADIALADALMSLGRRHREIAAVIPDLVASLRSEFPAGDAFFAAGAVSREAAFRLNIAADAGKLDQAFSALAARHEQMHRRELRLRTRLLLTRLVIIIMLIAGFVAGMFSGAPVGQLLAHMVLDLVAAFVLISLLIRSLRVERSTWLALAWRFGLLSRVHRLGSIFDDFFAGILQCQLEAGLAPSQALENSVGALALPDFARACNHAAAAIKGGARFCEALESEALLHDPELVQVIFAGEQSGRLAQSLGHYLELQRARIENWTDGMLEWLPRIAYLLALLMATDMLQMVAPA